MRQLKDTENRDKYKVYGELINAYGYNVPEGAKQMEALNYYTNETVTIPLDPTSTPQENAQRFFAKYNKQKRTSETARRQFEKMIRDYILKRENLVCLFVLIDSRLEPQKIDLEFMEWLGENGVPFVMIFTKADKLSATQRLKCIDDYHKVMLETWETTPMAFMTSSEKRLGREEVLDYIDELNRTVKL